MNQQGAERIADSILCEGYMLYPYRLSALKNRQRWAVGTLYPPAYEEVGLGSESDRMHVECLITGTAKSVVHVQLRFLQLVARQVLDADERPVDSLEVNGRTVHTWDEGVARSFESDVAIVTRVGASFDLARR